MSDNRKRIALLDEIRGICVLCMIFYHSFIFMYEQYGIEFGNDAFNFFLPVQPFFSCMFIFICGICCRLSHSNVKRGLKLLVFAVALNFVSIIVLPKLGFENTEIWWGILDFFTVCILGFALLEKPLTKIPVIIGILLCGVFLWLFHDWVETSSIIIWKDIKYTLPISVHEIQWLFPIGIVPFNFYSADYFPLIPYGFVFLMGTYFGIPIRDGKLPDFAYPVHSKLFDFLGRNCFLIYIIHLPIIYVILEFYTWIVGKIGA